MKLLFCVFILKVNILNNYVTVKRDKFVLQHHKNNSKRPVICLPPLSVALVNIHQISNLGINCSSLEFQTEAGSLLSSSFYYTQSTINKSRNRECADFGWAIYSFTYKVVSQMFWLSWNCHFSNAPRSVPLHPQIFTSICCSLLRSLMQFNSDLSTKSKNNFKE